QEPPPLLVPWSKATPAGTPVTVTVTVSEPSGSVGLALTGNDMGVSSRPVNGEVTVRLGTLATALTLTTRDAGVELAVLPLEASREAAVTVMLMPVPEVAVGKKGGGVNVSPLTCAGVK